MNKKLFILVLVFFLFSCQENTKIDDIPKETEKVIEEKNTTQKVDEVNKVDNTKKEIEINYINPKGTTIKDRFNTPKGFKRIKTDDYGEFIRNIKLLEDKSPVLLYNGDKKFNQNVHLAVLDIDVDDIDLQQCADAALRLRCEYLYQNNKDEMINYHLTNGDEFPYEKYRDGFRLSVSGNKVELIKKADYDRTYKTFRNYLLRLFTYAGTLSVSKESTEIKDEEVRIGDIFIKGGSPGHCVIIVDICENEKKEKLFLLAQSYMPAQQIHILKNPNNKEDNPWYTIHYPLITPEWTFDEGSLKRMP